MPDVVIKAYKNGRYSVEVEAVSTVYGVHYETRLLMDYADDSGRAHVLKTYTGDRAHALRAFSRYKLDIERGNI